MPEYRYLGVNVAGKPIQGVLFGTGTKAVKNRIKKLVDKKGIRLDAIQKKSKFIYKVQKDAQAVQANQDAVLQDCLNIAARAQEWYRKHVNADYNRYADNDSAQYQK